MFLFAPIRWAIRLPVMLIVGAAAYVVVSGVQVLLASREVVPALSLGRPAAVVVLPAPLVAGAPGADLTGRLEEALDLSRAGVASRIVVAGAPVRPGAPSPSAVARAWLVARGVPPSAILALDAPTASATLSTLPAVLGASARVVVVTDALDALFVRGAAAGDGLEAVVEPAVGSRGIGTSMFGQLWRQATGVAAGRVIGFSHVSWAQS
jgi:hypothetical protein